MTDAPRRMSPSVSKGGHTLMLSDQDGEYVHIDDFTAVKAERDAVNREVDFLLRAHDACLDELERLGAPITPELFGAVADNKTGDT